MVVFIEEHRTKGKIMAIKVGTKVTVKGSSSGIYEVVALVGTLAKLRDLDQRNRTVYVEQIEECS